MQSLIPFGHLVSDDNAVGLCVRVVPPAGQNDAALQDQHHPCGRCRCTYMLLLLSTAMADGASKPALLHEDCWTDKGGNWSSLMSRRAGELLSNISLQILK